MKCAICPFNAMYRVAFSQTGKMVYYCGKHGEFYVKLQIKSPNKYKVYSIHEFKTYTNRITKRLKSMSKSIGILAVAFIGCIECIIVLSRVVPK